MHQPIDLEPIVARFTFAPSRAEEFLADKDENGDLVYNGRLVTQIDCDSIEEVMEYVTQFGDAITDANAIINGRVINLSDFPLEGGQ